MEGKAARCGKTSAWDPANKQVRERALAYAIWVDGWADDRADRASDRLTAEARDVVIALGTPLAVEIATALDVHRRRVTAPSAELRRVLSATLSIDRSIRAWEQLVTAGEVPTQLGDACIAELRWLQARLADV